MQLNKKTILTIAALNFIPFSQAFSAEAKVSFYGLIDLYAAAKKSAADNSRKFSVDSSGLTTSFVGVKSDIEITKDTKGMIVLESFLQPDIGESGRFEGDTFYARDAFVGISGKLGSVTTGRLTTPYFLSVIQSNTFGGSFGLSPSINHSFLGGLLGDSGWSNAIGYSAPDYKGFSSSIMYSAGEIANDSTSNKIGANMFYSIGKLSTTIALQSVDAAADDPTAPLDDTQKAAMIGAKYDLGSMTLSLQFLRMITNAEAGDVGYKTSHIGVTIPFSGANILISYAGTKSKPGADGYVSRKSGSIGYLRDINKLIDMYVVFYDDKSPEYDVNEATLAFGGRFKF